MTKKCVVERLELHHAEELFQLIDKSRGSLSAWLTFPTYTHSVSDTVAFIKKSLKRSEANNKLKSRLPPRTQKARQSQ
ncbi:hypothetical protein MKX54_12570 [Alkalihalobacillus sp. FSL R5-0424]